MSRSFLRLVFGLALAMCAAGAAVGQDEGGSRDPRRALERFQEYLDRKPYNDWAFGKLVEAAVSLNELQKLVASYEARAEKEKDDRAVHVVLARLYTQTGESAKALATLRAIPEPDAGLLRLIGAAELARNQPKAAAEVLAQAAAATKDRELLKEIEKLRGEALLAGGDRPAAAEAFRALAALEPQNFNARLDVATALAQHGLIEEALAEFAVAETLAGADNSKRCRVLAEIGKLREVRLEIPAALDAYWSAIDKMARGNWLQRELEDRVLAIHKRGESLPALCTKLEQRVAAHPEDLDAREFQARALVESGQAARASEVLAKAVADFPDDLKLSRARLELLATLGDRPARIAEYQRALAKHPEELELYIELGRVFAEAGELEQARLQWQRTLEQRLADAGLASRLAELYTQYGLKSEAEAMYKKAIALEPRDIGRYGDLAAFLAAESRTADLAALYDQAVAAAGDDASRLEQVSALLRERGEKDRALELLVRAVERKSDDARLLAALADLQIELGHTAEATAALERAVETAEDGALRKACVDRVLRLARKQNTLRELVAAERARVATGAKELAPYLILGRALVQERDTAGAAEVYEKLLAASPGQEEARAELARLAEDQGDREAALAQYQALCDEHPKSRRTWLKEMARIHLALYDQDKAFALYQEMLQASPDNPAAFKEVAEAYARLGMADLAAECLQQAVRLKPEDGRMRLDLAARYQELGETDKAREEIRTAMRATDRQVADRARAQYYGALSQDGRVQSEIEALRRKIEDNPYDVEDSLLLGDIYVRELEYELALEMFEKLLRFQPRDERLLGERARILSLMDRYTEAIADYDTLNKLPDVDREDLAVKTAEAAIRAGDLERAASAGETLKSKERLARIYRRNGLYDQAVALLRASADAAPNDPKRWRSLSASLEEAGDRAGAAEALERALALEGEDFRTLVQLGGLYHELSRKAECAECGARLFALARLPEKEADQEEEDAEQDPDTIAFGGSRSYGWYGYGAGDPRYRELLQSITQYFVEKGLTDELREIAVAELQRQPANADLFEVVLGALLDDPGNARTLLEVLRTVRAATVDQGRAPSGRTLPAWRDMLDQRWTSVVAADKAVCDERKAELRGKLADASASERDFVELVTILDRERDDAAANEAAAQGLERFPASAQLLARAATRAEQGQDWPAAEAGFAKLLAALTPDPGLADEAADREQQFKLQRSNLQNQLPLALRRKTTEADLRRAWEIYTYKRAYVTFGPGTRSSAVGARLGLARALARQGKADAAREAVAPLAPAKAGDPKDLQAWSQLGNHFFGIEAFDDAAKAYLEVERIEKALESDALVTALRRSSSGSNEPMRNLARIEAKGGDVIGAYDRMREWGQVREGELLLSTNKAFETAEARYREQWAAEQKAFAAAGAAAVDDVDRRAALRSAGIKLAEVLQFQKRWADALAIWQALSEKLPDDFQVRDVAADVLERLERYDEAIEQRLATIDAKRAWIRAHPKGEAPARRELTPDQPPRAEGVQQNWVWQNLQNAGARWGPMGRLPSPNEDYAAILRILLDRRQTSRAAALMKELAREDAQTFRWMGYTLSQVVQNYRMGADGVPILRLLHGYDPRNEQVSLQYGESLIAADRLDEAERVLQAVAQNATTQSYYRERAEASLKSLAARAGRDTQTSLDALAKSVAADPKNVKARTRYARALFRDERFDDALEQAHTAEELAPHLDEVASILADSLAALGRWDEYAARLEADYKKAKRGEEKFKNGIRLASCLWGTGKRDAARAVLESEDMAYEAGQNEYSVSGWYMQHGEFADALRIARADLEKSRSQRWEEENVRRRVQSLALLGGDLQSALDESWKRFQEATSPGVRASAFQSLVGMLAGAPDPRELRPRIEEASAAAGGTRARLGRIAAALAARDLAGADKELGALMAEDPTQVFLYPLWVAIERSRGDLEGALARLQDLSDRKLGSEQTRISTTAGYISERDALRGEKGELLLLLGRRDEALASWKEIFDPNDVQSWNALSTLYREHELWTDALDMKRRYLEKVGERNWNEVQILGDLELELGHFDAAVAAYDRALILAGADATARGTVRARILDAYRRSGRLADALADFRARLAKDPSDIEFALFVAGVATEAGDAATRAQILEGAATRAGFEVAVLPLLAQARLAAGDVAGAEQALASLLDANVNEWQRREPAMQLARIRWARGDQDGALAALSKAYQDPESSDAMQGTAGLLAQLGGHERAAALAAKLVERDPRDAEGYAILSRALEELDREGEALDAALKAERLSSWSFADASIARLEWLARISKSDERIEAALAAAPDDPAALFAAAALDLANRRDDRARARFARLAELKPDELAAFAGMSTCDRRAKRWAQALESEQTLATLLERRTLSGRIDPWQLRNRSEELGPLALRASGPEAAIRLWKEPLPRFERDVQPWSYTYYNEPEPISGLTSSTLLRHGLYREALDAQRLQDLTGNQYGWDQVEVQAMLRLGERAQAEELMWWQLDDSVRELVQTQTNGRYYVDEGSLREPSFDALVNLYREEGRVGDLAAKLADQRAQHPTQLAWGSRLRRLMAAAKMWKEDLALVDEALLKSPENAGLLAERVTALAELKRWADAAAAQERCLRQSERPDTGLVQRRMVLAGSSGTTSGVRFQWGGGTAMGYGTGSSYMSSSAGRMPSSAGRRRWMALLAAAGRAEDARRIESEELNARALEPGTPMDLAHAYAAVGRVADAERMCALAIEVDAELYEGDAAELLAEAWRKAGDSAARTRWHEKRLALAAHEVERTPKSADARRSRARLILTEGGDLAVAAADLESLAGWGERSSQSLVLEGWLALRRGKPAEALALLDAARAESLLEGTWSEDALQLAGRALALATLGRKDEGWPFLRRAETIYPEHATLDEARKALEEPRGSK